MKIDSSTEPGQAPAARGELPGLEENHGLEGSDRLSRVPDRVRCGSSTRLEAAIHGHTAGAFCGFPGLPRALAARKTSISRTDGLRVGRRPFAAGGLGSKSAKIATTTLLLSNTHWQMEEDSVQRALSLRRFPVAFTSIGDITAANAP